MSETFAQLLARVKSKSARVGIIGLGYVGLPLARAFTGAGFRVLGFDVDPHKVTKLTAGRSYIKQIPDDAVHGMRDRGFEATNRFDRLGEADAVLICVPTPLTDAREPDLTYVNNSALAVAGQLRPGQLVVLESTTYPTTTRNDVLPILERTGLAAGSDFFLAFSPEREDPGNAGHSVHNIPKVVGGLCDRSTELACALYSAIVPQVVRVSSPEVAEACKILENTYRAVNIALVNELKVLYDRMGIDVWEVIDAAKTKPFGFQAFYPGPGLGGHCIPIDPFYLTWVARKYGMNTRFIELAGEVNTAMPTYVVNRVADALNDRGKAVKESRVAILGMAYKKDVDDPRESPGFELMDLLRKKGARVTYNDPHIPALPRMRHWPHLEEMKSQPLSAEYLSSQDCVLIATDHSAYDYGFIAEHARLVVDTRNATKYVRGGREHVIRADEDAAMYRVYGILTPAADFTLDEAAHRLAARFAPGYVRAAPGIVLVGTDDWAMQLQMVQGPDVRSEHAGVAAKLAGGDAQEIATCDRRVEAWSDMPDMGMEHFADFQTVIEVLKSFPGVVVVDPKEPNLL